MFYDAIFRLGLVTLCTIPVLLTICHFQINLKPVFKTNWNFLNITLRGLMSTKSNLNFPYQDSGFSNVLQPLTPTQPHFLKHSKGKHFIQGRVVSSLFLIILHAFISLPFIKLFYSPEHLLSTRIYIPQIIQHLFKSPTSPKKNLWRTPTTNDFLHFLATSRT